MGQILKSNYEANDLVYMFDAIDGAVIQQMLIALKHDYELKSVTNAKGCVQFVLSLKKDK